MKNAFREIKSDDYHYWVTWRMPDTLAILVNIIAEQEGISFHDGLQHIVELGLIKRGELTQSGIPAEESSPERSEGAVESSGSGEESVKDGGKKCEGSSNDFCYDFA